MNTESLVPSVILHIPHSSIHVPADVRVAITLSDEELQDELLRMTDAYTDDLFAPPDARFGAVIYCVSRLVVDPERFPDDEREPMSSKGMGAIYTRTSRGTPLRPPPTTEERIRLLGRFYWPHHRQLESAVAASLRAHGRTLIIDCHSFPAVPSPYEIHQSPDRPDICIGTDSYHTPTALTDLLAGLFRARGLSVALNVPFAGALVPLRHYGRERAVNSVMIELNRGLYMDARTGGRSCGYAGLKDAVQEIMMELADCRWARSTSGQ